MAKSRKVEESGVDSTSPKPTPKEGARSPSSPTRRVDDKTFRTAAEKVFKTHRDLLRRLAQ